MKTKSRHIHIQKSGHIQNDHVFYYSNKQCNGTIKGRLHCLTSGSKEDFLSLIQYFLAQHDVWSWRKSNRIFFNKKIQIGRPENSLPTLPPPLRSLGPPTSPANPFVSIEYDRDLRHERVHALSLVCIHRDIFFDYDKIIDIYVSKYLRRI